MTSAPMEWESRLGRRLRVRDLYILSTVVRSGSMAKGARQLAMTQPAVSEAIANLEHALGVRLLDRSPRGIEPTIYADALLKRSLTVFDELKESVKDIEFLADPTRGELRIGSPESITATVLPQFIEHFSGKHPGVVVHVHDVPSPAIRNPGLRERKYDLVLARLGLPRPDDHATEDLNLESLFDDPLMIAAGPRNRWTRRRAVDLAELVDEPWLLSPDDAWNYIGVSEAFRAKGLGMPKVTLRGFSLHLATYFVANGPFLTAYPRTVIRRWSLKSLCVDMPLRPWPVVIATLKNRTLSPVAERFIECARQVAKSLVERPQTRKS
jgi:DNA-binding transcriptional LysR family regulator